MTSQQNPKKHSNLLIWIIVCVVVILGFVWLDEYLSKKNSSPPPSHYSAYTPPRTAENNSYYGQTSENTGRPKTVYVRGYYRNDGTYVRSHYRSKPR